MSALFDAEGRVLTRQERLREERKKPADTRDPCLSPLSLSVSSLSLSLCECVHAHVCVQLWAEVPTLTSFLHSPHHHHVI